MGYDKYRCPVCKEEMERDMLLFLNHTNGHIKEAMKKEHPEWVSEDGECEPCERNLQAQFAA